MKLLTYVCLDRTISEVIKCANKKIFSQITILFNVILDLMQSFEKKHRTNDHIFTLFSLTMKGKYLSIHPSIYLSTYLSIYLHLTKSMNSSTIASIPFAEK